MNKFGKLAISTGAVLILVSGFVGCCGICKQNKTQQINKPLTVKMDKSKINPRDVKRPLPKSVSPEVAAAIASNQVIQAKILDKIGQVKALQGQMRTIYADIAGLQAISRTNNAVISGKAIVSVKPVSSPVNVKNKQK